MVRQATLALTAALSLMGCSSLSGGGSASRDEAARAALPTELSETATLEAAAASAADPRQAANMYHRAYERRPSGEMAAREARSLRYAGDSQAAVVLLQKVSKDYPENQAVLVELGRSALAGGYMPEATDALVHATTLPSAGWEAFMTYGALLARKKDWPGAEAAFMSAVSKATSTRDAISAKANVAMLKADRGDIRGAIADLEVLAARPGVNPKVKADLALLYGMTGNTTGFREQANKAGMAPTETERAEKWLTGK